MSTHLQNIDFEHLFGQHAEAARNAVEQIVAPLLQENNQLRQQIGTQPLSSTPNPPPTFPTATDIANAFSQISPSGSSQSKDKDPNAATPPIFAGDRSQAREWLKAVRVYIQLSPSRFPPEDEERRILWALSYIRGGSAGAWAENHTEAILDPNVESPFITFEGFLNTFEAAYCELDRAEMARQKIKLLKMKPGDTVETYTTAFEALANHTGYNETALIEQYRGGLIKSIVEKIYSSPDGTLPKGLTGWKAKARQIDNLWQEFKGLQRQTSSHLTSKHLSTSVSPSTSKTATSSSGPEPMDVDSHRRTIRCYNCNQFGHMARNCPNPRQSRSIRGINIPEIVTQVCAALAAPAEEENKDFLESQQ